MRPLLTSTAVLLLVAINPNASQAKPKPREIEVRVDASVNVLVRDTQSKGAAYLFADAKRYSLSIRGAIWCPATGNPTTNWPIFRVGGWLGYRYEPGAASTSFERPATSNDDVGASRGLRSWALSHDLSLGLVVDGALGRKSWAIAPFVRLYGGAGGTFTTLQIQSLDDGHTYSRTDPGLNLSSSVELGARLGHGIELLAGVGYLWSEASVLHLSQDDATFPKDITLSSVPRKGKLYYAGLGLEF